MRIQWTAAPLLIVALSIHAEDVLPKSESNSSSDMLQLDEEFSADIKPAKQLSKTEPASEADFYTRHLAKKFTFKLNQQVYSQIHDHVTASGVAKTPTIEDNRLNLNIKYQNPFASGWSFQASAQAKLYWPSDYEHGTSNQSIDMEGRVDELEARLNEFYLTKNLDQHTFKLGRQTIVWGEAEGNSILDTLNTTEYRDLSIIEIEDARLNQWLLVWDFFGDEQQRLSSFINFDPQFNPNTRINSPAYVPVAVPLTGPDDKTRFEFGTRWQWSIEHSDLAVMAAYLFENPLRYDVAPDLSVARANDNGYWLLGASANRAIGKLLLKLDLAFSHGVLADTLVAPGGDYLFSHASSMRSEQIGFSTGFEYAISNQQSISLSALARHFIGLDESLRTNETSANGDVFGSWLMRYSHSFDNNDWVFSSTMNGSLNGDRVLISGSVLYSVNDHWSLLTQVITTFADKNSSFAILDKDVRLGFTISYSN